MQICRIIQSREKMIRHCPSDLSSAKSHELSAAYRHPTTLVSIGDGKEKLASAFATHRCGRHSRDLKEEQQQLRKKINSRERKRMQDLNLAMDALREVIMPYSATHCQSSPGRKLSKIATLLLARNYILLLGSSLQELRRIIGDMSGPSPRLLLAGLPLFAAPGSVFLAPGNAETQCTGKLHSLSVEEQPCSAFTVPGGSNICACSACRFSHFIPTNLNMKAVQLPK